MYKTEFIPKKEYMLRATELAIEAGEDGEIPVGAVIELEGKIIGYGRNRCERNGSQLAHAEIEAITMACKNLGDWRLFNCNLYVTLEPCVMCTGAIINSRINTVIFGAEDYNALSFSDIVLDSKAKNMFKPKIFRGYMQAECLRIMKQYFSKMREDT